MKNILVKKENYITTILINRPDKRNAVDGITADELTKAFTHFDQEEDSYVAILGGTEGNFCAGADLKAGGISFSLKRGK